MHELEITQNILTTVLEYANKKEARKVRKIHLEIGEMTQVVDECVKFYFEVISKDTIAEGAEIEVIKIPLKACCENCGKEFVVKDFDFSCPLCSNLSLEITGGKELNILSIEIE